VVQLLLFGAVDVVVGGSVVVVGASIERRVVGASFVVESFEDIAVGSSVVDVGASVVDDVVGDSVEDIVFDSSEKNSCRCCNCSFCCCNSM
jgi:hypothetical protein